MLGTGWDFLNVDGERGEFYFHVGKYSGKLILDGNRNAVTIPNIPGLKIQSPFNSSDNNWIITTPERTKYILPNTTAAVINLKKFFLIQLYIRQETNKV